MPRRPFLVALLFVAVVLFFVGLGDSSIWDANEAFYVETPREMIERGDYVFPTFNYEPRLNKPVLSYWIVAAFYHLFGVSPGVQRVPIALGGLALVATAFLLARIGWSGSGTDESRNAVDAGLWAAIGLAASPRLMIFARRIFIDIYISMFMGLTLLWFALAERYPSRRRPYLALMYLTVGLATLTKGPIAVALPGLVFVLYLLAYGELRRAREMMLAPGILIVSAIVVPWYVALYQRDGWTPITSFVFGENLARFTEGVGVNAQRGPLFYVPVVLADAFPWSLLLPAAAIWWFEDRRARPVAHAAASRVRSLLWLWILVIVGFFSLSEAKQDLYVFPIVPAVASLGGLALVRTFSEPSSRLRLVVRWAAALAGLVLIVLGAGVVFLFRSSASVDAATAVNVSGALALGAVVIGGGTLALVAALAHRLTAAMLAVAGALVASNWLIVVRVLPAFEVYKPVPGLSRVLAERAAPDDAIATYNVALPSLVYYLRRHILMSYEATPIVELLSSGRRAFVVLPERDYEAVRAQARAQLCVVGTHATFDVRLRNVLARDPLPQLLLITNRCGP